jgi:hypothetical protein
VYFIIFKWNIYIWTSAIYILSVYFFFGGGGRKEHNWLIFFSSAIFASKIWLVYSKNLDILYVMFYLTLATPCTFTAGHIWLRFVDVHWKYSLRMCVTFSLRSSGRISSKSAFYSSLTKSSSAIFIFQMTNDAINLRPILECISTFPKMTILNVLIQGYIAWSFSIEINRKIFIII